MPRFAFLLVFLLFSLPVFAASPGVDPGDPYTVTGIGVDVKGANGSEARDKAFTDGGRLALAALAVKLTGAKEPDFKAVDNNTITRLIKSFEVETEKPSSTRYIATLTYHFKPSMTDSFLTARGMSIKDPSELEAQQQPATAAVSVPNAPAAPRIVILPIVRSGDRSVLWEERTDWARAFENYLSDHPTANVVIPGGEMEDINTISASEALAGQQGPLTKIMHNYEAQGALVAVLAAPSITPTPERDLNVQLAIFDRAGVMHSVSSFNLAAAPSRKAAEWLQDGAGAAISKWQAEAQKITAPPRRVAGIPDAAITPNGQLQLAINVPFASPQQWQAMRSALQETNGVTRFDVVGLSHSRATALVTYQGSRASLEGSLREKGLRLEQTSPTGPVTLVSSNTAQAAPTTTMQPASTFQTVYPPPPVPKDEIIYADPDEKKGDSKGDNADNGDDTNGRAPPPPVTSKKAPSTVPSQELPPLIP